MHFAGFLSALALTASTALAATSIVINQCGFDVWVTSVGSSVGSTSKLASGDTWTEGQYFDGIGTAIKITQTATGLWANKPVLTFAYTYHQGVDIYYSLGSHAGFDFLGDKLVLHGEDDKNAEEIVWDGAPKPDHTAYYQGETDLTLVLCA